jgi:hypothetical protein
MLRYGLRPFNFSVLEKGKNTFFGTKVHTKLRF